MKLTPTYAYLKNGKRIINGYKVTLTKSEVEKIGLRAGDELQATYEKERIVLKKAKWLLWENQTIS